MRTIKVRLWDKNNKFFYQWDQLINMDHIGKMMNDTEHYEVQHFTGMKDKDGMEVYEGDVVQDEEATYRIYWDHKYLCYDAYRLEDGSDMLSFGNYQDDVVSDIIQTSKVIGNIHEDIELANP